MPEAVAAAGSGVLELVGAGAVVLAQVVLLVAIPIAYGYAGVALIRLLANRDYWTIPPVARLSLLAGLLMGVALLLSSPQAYKYDPNEIFVDGGYWNVDLGTFLAERANVLSYGVDGLIDRLTRPHRFDGFDLFVTAIFGMLLAAVALLLRYFRGGDRWRALAASLAAFVWAAYMAIYLIALTCYVLYKLNFWSVLLVTLVLQVFRHRRRHRGH